MSSAAPGRPDTPPAKDHLALIAALQATTMDVLRPLIPTADAVALLDFPSYPNVGDSAIWLGELRYLRALGVGRPKYTSDLHLYRREALARRIGSGTILLSGGGNFGDLYGHHQRFREAVIAAFPNNPIVQLPQSMFFRNTQELARARAVYNQHPNLTLLLRDRRSLELAANNFKARVALCPDLAFGLGQITRPRTPEHNVLWLIRRDEESAVSERQLPAGVFADWYQEEPRTRVLAAYTFLRRLVWKRRAASVARVLISASHAAVARSRVAAGCALLSEAAAVVTDRLHGHILALLLGIPHVLLDNSYGKVRNFVETWTSECKLTHWAESPGEAQWLAAAAARNS